MNRLITFIALFFIAACSNSQTKPENPEIWKHYSASNFTTQYPLNWELDLSGSGGSTFAILSPKESIEDQFRENLNLLVQDLKGSGITTLSDFAKISEEQIVSSAPNGKLLKSNKTNASSMDCHHFLFTFNNGRLNLQCEQFIWIIDDEAYILTFTAKQDTYEQYKSIGKLLLSKFELNSI